MAVGECPCCLIDGIELIDNRVAARTLSDKQASVELDVTVKDYVIHYETHVRNKIVQSLSNNTEIEAVTANVLDAINTITNAIERTQEVAITVFAEIKENPTNDAKMLSAYTGIEKAIAEQVVKLASITGELKDAQQINIQNNIINIDKLEAKMMENLCQVCKLKMAPEIVKLAK